MTYILKSNKIVEDNNGRFPYLTPYGETNKYVSNYYENMLLVGYEITKAEFDILNEYTSGLISSGAINAIVELYPFMGNSVDAMLTKLVFVDNPRLGKIASFGAANIDSKGIKFDTYKTSRADALKTNILLSSIFGGNGFGVSAYVKYNNTDGKTNTRTIVGVSNSVPGADTGSEHSVSLSRRPDGRVINKFLVSSPSTTPISAETDAGILTIYNKWNTSKIITERGVRFKGVSLSSSTSAVQLSNPIYDTDFYVGASHVSSDNLAYYGFHGHIRSLALLNGSHDTVVLQTIEGLTEVFINQTGKNVF